MQDASPYIVIINFLIGVLLMMSSGRVGEFAALPFSRRPQEAARVMRYAHITVLAFGAVTAILMAGIYVLFHLLRIGV